MSERAVVSAVSRGRSLAPYPHYKGSVAPWVGHIPSHWVTTRLGNVLRLQRGHDLPEHARRHGPYPVVSSCGTSAWHAEAKVTGPGVVTGRYGTIGEVFYIEGDFWPLNTALYVIDFKGNLPRFVRYLLMSVPFDTDSEKSAVPGVNRNHLHALVVARPPVQEQQAIADFLDEKTAQIDELIAKKQRLIELLQEKRTALISHAVTKGIDPNVPMKDSGVEWLGEIPAHWRVMALKRGARPGRRTFTDGDWIEAPFIEDDGIRLIQTGNVGTGDYREQGYRYISEATFHDLKCTEVVPDDVLVCRLDGPVGRACLAPDLGVRMVTSVDNTILKPNADHDPRFLVHFMSSQNWLGWIQALCRVGGGFRLRVSRSMLGELRIAAPPREEQGKIADLLDRQNRRTARLLSKVSKGIDRLKEYRAALISAAVTGKIAMSGR